MVRTAAMAMLVCSAPLLLSTDARDKASEYPVHFKSGDLEIGAEYMVRSVSLHGTTITIDDYLVVEVAIYPPPGREILVNAQDFLLRVNGKKELLHAQPASMVAASIKYPDWRRRPGVEVGGAVGDSAIILGRRQSVERFPGDNRPVSQRMPNPVPPVSTAPQGAEDKDPVDAVEMVQNAALPEGTRKKPIAGLVYFAFHGKLKSLKTVDLVVKTESGDLVSTRLR